MRKIFCIAILMICILFLVSCNAKLSTIRPTLITRIVIEDIKTGDQAELLRDSSDEIDWMMDDLVLQMEQFYAKKGECTAEDEHAYKVDYYFDEKIELAVIIHDDASVCIDNIRYELADKENSEQYQENWEEAFALGSGDAE